MDNEMRELEQFEQQYAAAKEHKRKRKRTALICICVFTVVVTALGIFFFRQIPWSAEDLDVEAIVEDGIVWVYANRAQSGGKNFGCIGKSTLAGLDAKREIYYTDYENRIEYTDYHIRFENSRWGLLFHPVRRGVQKLYIDGREAGAVDKGGKTDRMAIRHSRLIYDNPDGTYVILWECEDIVK